MRETFQAMKEHSQEKRANNRDRCAMRLHAEGVMFEAKNNGAHLIVEGNVGYIDYWPGTGKWKDRQGASGFGIQNLLKHIKSGDTP